MGNVLNTDRVGQHDREGETGLLKGSGSVRHVWDSELTGILLMSPCIMIAAGAIAVSLVRLTRGSHS